MKRAIDSRVDELLIDVVEYAFTEWLVRRGVFSAFRSNFEPSFSLHRSFRDRLRDHIRHSLRVFAFGPTHLISSAFLYTSTPEGSKFWEKQSAAWERFCAKFQKKF